MTISDRGLGRDALMRRQARSHRRIGAGRAAPNAMRTANDCHTIDPDAPRSCGRSSHDVTMLVVCWSSTGEHLGETLRVRAPAPTAGWIFGRDGSSREAHGRLCLVRRRPGSFEARPFVNPYVSRVQLLMQPVADGIDVQNIGKRRLIADDGVPSDRVVVRPGETLEIEDQLLFVCVTGPRELPGVAPEVCAHPFASSDALGIVGESPAAWRLRESVAFVASREGHVLVLGQSGTGKELVAQGIHALSSRARRPLVARNAAALPSGLVDAELFGNVGNYPNAGSPERPGLIGQAHGSTLFLDEIGELPLELQTHLLRVLDAGGEYQRLGESRGRTADIRIIGATSRSLDQLRPDFAARFKLHVELPGLSERREDIPLIVRHLLARAQKADPLGARLFRGIDEAELVGARVKPALVRYLVTHRYTTHVRELDALLWRAIAEARDRLDLPRRAGVSPSNAPAPLGTPAPLLTRKSAVDAPPTAGEVRACLERHGGVKERAWRELGLSSRYALKRLIRKYELAAAGVDPESR